jgi:hypothetical protein
VRRQRRRPAPPCACVPLGLRPLRAPPRRRAAATLAAGGASNCCSSTVHPWRSRQPGS